MASDLNRFAHFADRYVGVHSRTTDQVLLGDMRYGLPVQSATPLWGIGFSPADPGGRANRQNFGDQPRSDLSGQLWQKVKGGACEQPSCIILAP